MTRERRPNPARMTNREPTPMTVPTCAPAADRPPTALLPPPSRRQFRHRSRHIPSARWRRTRVGRAGRARTHGARSSPSRAEIRQPGRSRPSASSSSHALSCTRRAPCRRRAADARAAHRARRGPAQRATTLASRATSLARTTRPQNVVTVPSCAQFTTRSGARLVLPPPPSQSASGDSRPWTDQPVTLRRLLQPTRPWTPDERLVEV